MLGNISFLNINWIHQFQNVCVLGISLSSTYCYLKYAFGSCEEPPYSMFESLVPFIGIHVGIDLLVTKNRDYQMHHVFVLCIAFYDAYYHLSSSDKFPILLALLKTEISSIFLALQFWLPKKSVLTTVNNLLFYLAFLKFRVIDYFQDIQNDYIINTVFPKYSNGDTMVDLVLSTSVLLSFYGLYILNLYWFTIMSKILYKQIAKSIDYETVCHFLCSYLLFVNVPLAAYLYSYKNDERNVFDMIGISGLSLTSFYYHYDIYKRLTNKTIKEYKFPSRENIHLFLNDTTMIHIRSFLAVATCYYYNTNLVPVLFISGAFHLLGMYKGIQNMINSFIEENEDNLFIHNINVMSAITVDILLLLFLYIGTNDGKSFLVVNVLIGLLYLVEPFGKLTHVGFHILLIAQNYYICLTNRSGEIKSSFLLS